ncbi:MAG: 4-hydroxy-3-methylbut-2-en-1-yl diphosphate synthase [Planctomycetia bacterium]|nr:4-hydroxy-3-methylbut-2-en-1-yl diphosphate synthase [Planctomycetia bacterium]
MENAEHFRRKLRTPEPCLGTCVTFSDPTVTEALATVLDFVWIDAEHNPMSLETIQAHVMATRGTRTTPLVRVAWNDPVLIKPVLDIGAAGIIVPLIRTADDARRAVAACKYPPEGIRGFGPRRPAGYGTFGGPEYCRAANAAIITIVQIEHADAVKNLEEIIGVAGLTSIVIGAQDLAGSMGHMGQPEHPEVQGAIDSVIERARRAGMPVGMALGDRAEAFRPWRAKGVQWFSVAADFLLLQRAAADAAAQIRSFAAG